MVIPRNNVCMFCSNHDLEWVYLEMVCAWSVVGIPRNDVCMFWSNHVLEWGIPRKVGWVHVL